MNNKSLALIFLLLKLPNGVDAAGTCFSSDDYKCGGGDVKLNTLGNDIWEASCEENECCCKEKEGWNENNLFGPYQLNTCDNQGDNTVIGCFACTDGGWVCMKLTNSKVGDYGCWGENACRESDNIIVGIESCHGEQVCKDTGNFTVGNTSCVGEHACKEAKNLAVGNDSCNGQYSCNGASGASDGWHAFRPLLRSRVRVLEEAKNVTTIGDNCCNDSYICAGCEGGSVVPHNTCNDLDNEDEVGVVPSQIGNRTDNDDGRRCRACYVSTMIVHRLIYIL